MKESGLNFEIGYGMITLPRNRYWNDYINAKEQSMGKDVAMKAVTG